MFPVRDNIPSKSVPVVNVALIAANVGAFVYELSLGRHIERFVLHYGLIPNHLDPGDFITHMFLHGGWMHLISNVWSLWIFGDNVEDRLGHFRYLCFYLLSGIAAATTQVAAAWGSPAPVIGASGAIAGVMGAYFFLFPKARVVTVVPVFIFLHWAEIPAWAFLGLWFGMQVYFGSLPGHLSGVAWWAHVGGFAAGALLLLVFKTRGHR